MHKRCRILNLSITSPFCGAPVLPCKMPFWINKKAICKTNGFCDPDWIRTNDLLLSLPTTVFTAPSQKKGGIWGLDYIFTISGAARVVSTVSNSKNPLQTIPLFPDCFLTFQHEGLRFY